MTGVSRSEMEARAACRGRGSLGWTARGSVDLRAHVWAKPAPRHELLPWLQLRPNRHRGTGQLTRHNQPRRWRPLRTRERQRLQRPLLSKPKLQRPQNPTRMQPQPCRSMPRAPFGFHPEVTSGRATFRRMAASCLQSNHRFRPLTDPRASLVGFDADQGARRKTRAGWSPANKGLLPCQTHFIPS